MKAIIAVGYNRVDSMKRLLDSVCRAKYTEQYQLIVSLDLSDKQDELVQIAKACDWPEEYKTIVKHSDRMKLKKHLLSCGDMTSEYEAVVVLEDDIVVSERFPEYIEQAIHHYGDIDEIAGISLYTHSRNVEVNRPFEPANNGKQVFLMQFPQSWGQCWTRRMWQQFREWMSATDDHVFENALIPDNVKKWGAQSWLKYQVAYCVTQRKYYIYPYEALATNCSEVGTHNDRGFNSSYQVQLRRYELEIGKHELDELVRYDAFFERENIHPEALSMLGNQKVCMDLYGFKTDFQGYDILVTTNKYDYKCLQTIQLTYRPHEENLFYPIRGEGINIYDLSSGTGKKIDKDNMSSLVIGYDIKDYKLKPLVRYLVQNGLNDLKNILRKKLKG